LRAVVVVVGLMLCMVNAKNVEEPRRDLYICMLASPLTVSEHRPFIGAHSGKAEPGTILSRGF
jgi:hypothetical protein